MVAGSVTSAALPGAAAWDIVVGDRFIAALAAPAPDACTTALAEAASDARVSIETLVGCIPVGPAVAVDSFAIVWWPGADPSEVTAVVRGDAVVDLTSPGGTRRFDAHGIRPWHLADFSDVVGLRITAADAPLDRLGEAPDAVRHPRASLRASSIEWTPAPGSRPDHGAAIVDADTLLVPRSHQPSAEHATPHSVVPEHPVAEIDDADTILTPRQAGSGPAIRATTAVVAPTVVAPTVVPPALLPPVDDALVGPSTRPIALAPVPSVTESATVEAAPPADELSAPRAPRPTSVGTPPAASTAGPVVALPPAVAAPARSQPVPAFRIGGGPPHRVTVPVLIGRRPLAPRIPGVAGASPELVTVDSPQTVISSTHLELRLEGSRLIATDLRSTNGTIVRSPSGVRRMRAGESIVVAPGTSLDLGDDTIIEILLAPAAPAERSQTDSRPHP
jgi:FHA domain